MKPTVGRIVHFFHQHGAHPEAAIVVGQDRSTCQPSLLVFSEHGGSHFYLSVPNIERADTSSMSFWDWPEREPVRVSDEEEGGVLDIPISHFDGSAERNAMAPAKTEIGGGNVLQFTGPAGNREGTVTSPISPDPNDRPAA